MKKLWQLTSGWIWPTPIISEIIPYLRPTFPTPVHHSHALHPEITSYRPSPRLTRLCSPYFDSFPSHASKSFHLDGRCTWWFVPVVRTDIQHLYSPQAGLCSKVDKLVLHFSKLQNLVSSSELLMCWMWFWNARYVVMFFFPAWFWVSKGMVIMHKPRDSKTRE